MCLQARPSRSHRNLASERAACHLAGLQYNCTVSRNPEKPTAGVLFRLCCNRLFIAFTYPPLCTEQSQLVPCLLKPGLVDCGVLGGQHVFCCYLLPVHFFATESILYFQV